MNNTTVFARIVTLRLVLKTWNIATTFFPAARRTSDPTTYEREECRSCLHHCTGYRKACLSRVLFLRRGIYVCSGSVEPFGSSQVHRSSLLNESNTLEPSTLMYAYYILTGRFNHPSTLAEPNQPTFLTSRPPLQRHRIVVFQERPLLASL